MGLSKNETTILVGTIIFIVLWLVLAFILVFHTGKTTADPKLKSEYKIMSYSLTFLGAFCMWLMWVCVYMHQMYPIIEPIIKQEI